MEGSDGSGSAEIVGDSYEGDAETISSEELFTIAEDLVLEDESNAAALEALRLLFDILNPRRLKGDGADGRVSEPDLYKALTFDPQIRSLLAKAATHAAYCKSGYARVGGVNRTDYVDHLVNTLARKRDRGSAGLGATQARGDVQVQSGKVPAERTPARATLQYKEAYPREG